MKVSNVDQILSNDLKFVAMSGRETGALAGSLSCFTNESTRFALHISDFKGAIALKI